MPQTAAHARYRSSHDRPTDETIKETFESVIIAFILAFVFRAYVVEAFVIPTGSMAPTLMGQHLHVVCKECGYGFDVDPPGAGDTPREIPYALHAVCPMCLYPNTIQAGTIPSAGDRILVHKFVYDIVEPSRWDVVVFKNPQDPDVNFIKRLIGLPNEQIWIIEGNIYVKPASPAGAPWRIARKSEARQGELVQRAVWQPLYHSDYVPLDAGKPSINRTIITENYKRLDCSWHVPWVADEPGQWQMTDPAGQPLTHYRHTTAGAGQVRFDFSTTTEGVGAARWYPYNQLSDLNGFSDTAGFFVPHPVEDLRIAADFQADQPGLAVKLDTTARLDNPDPTAGPVPLEGSIDAEGHAVLQEIKPDGSTRVFGRRDVGPFTPGVARNVELWFVDQEASLWVDGRQVIDARFDLPIETVVNRLSLTEEPHVGIHVEGSPVTLYHVELDRDLYYTPGPSGTSGPGLGALLKTDTFRQGKPLILQADQFFCLGDNSPRSSDGRAWDRVNPWILEDMLADKLQQTGVVPRKLVMGRAFFVYFPAMYAWDAKDNGIFPDFGDVRFIH